MSYKVKKKETGFTIIEVLIVLAIAGLIMLVVFLAVPALQRNSRNTQRKADISAILAGINEYLADNNGALPSAALNWAAPTLTFNGAATNTSTQARIGFYTGGVGVAQGDITETAAPAFPVAALAGNAANDRVVINNGGACNGAAAAQGSPRQVAVQYEIENGSNSYAAACQDS